MTTAGIRTEYRKTSFRSRAEARWASFFDAIGWRWTYEPLDAGGYIPDFLIHGYEGRSLFIEVGPCITPDDFRSKADKPMRAVRELRHDLLVVGVDPIVGWANGGRPAVDGRPVAGWLGERSREHGCSLLWCDGKAGVTDWDADQVPCPSPLEFREEFDFDWGLWARCKECGEVGVFHSSDSFALRPCGHYDGDHHLGDFSRQSIETAWAAATNSSQWRRSA